MSLEVESVDEARDVLARNRKRDQIIGSTQKGPHRDDYSLSLDIGGAKEYASDGQQRGLCVRCELLKRSCTRSSWEWPRCCWQMMYLASWTRIAERGLACLPRRASNHCDGY